MNDSSQLPVVKAAHPLISVPKRTILMFKRHRILGIAAAVAMLLALYWMFVASDRYISEAHVIVQRTDMAGGESVDFSSLLSGSGGSHRADQLLLRDYLLSTDMLRILDTKLNLREHYSDWHRDPFSRMWFSDAPVEDFYRYYLTRVSIENDEYAGVLVIKAQAFDAKTAQAIAATLVVEGEKFMNGMAHNLAQDQVTFLEHQVAQLNERMIAANKDVLDYQNKEGLVSPQLTAEAIATVIAKLQAQRTDLQTQRGALLAYLVPNHPNIVQLEQQVAAIDKQISGEQAKLTSPNRKTLNRTVEEFQRLKRQAEFAESVYKTALVGLEKGRIEAVRTIKKLSVLQSATEPEYPLEPRRLYNTFLFSLVSLLVAGVVYLLVAIVRDHRD